MMSVSRILKWVGGGLECLWGFPILGGTLIVGLAWTPLVVMLAFHIVGLVFAIREGRNRSGHILGIVANAIGWIPLVGMIMHILTAIALMTEAHQEDEVKQRL